MEGKADIEGKYAGVNKRLAFFNQAFKSLATERGITVLDAFTIFSNYENTFTTDGVHLNEMAQKKLALQIQGFLFE